MSGEISTGGKEAHSVPRSKIISWASWDWGSAAFNAVATTFVFTVYLTAKDSFAPGNAASSYLSWGLAGAGVVIALLAPITGQRADRKGNGARVLTIFSALVFLCLAFMFLVYPESPMGSLQALWFGIALLGLGNIFFEFASVNYNAMLNDISTDKNRGAISGFGWGAGYLGGIVLLLFLYFGFINPEVGLLGVTSENGMDVRVSMLFAAAWFGLFALPVILNPPKRKPPTDNDVPESLKDSYIYLFRTIKSLWKDSPHTLRFLIASAVFRDGLAGVFTFGGIIAGTVFGFEAGQVIIFAIAANVVAGIATIAFGPLDDKFGSKRIIMVSLVLMLVAGLAVFLFWRQGAVIFWVFGLMLTIFVGPVQSASRTFLANIIPEGREGEVFGLYATTGRAVSFLAPLMYGIALAIGSAVTQRDAPEWGILGIMLVVALGLLLMIPVKQEDSRIVEVPGA